MLGSLISTHAATTLQTAPVFSPNHFDPPAVYRSIGGTNYNTEVVQGRQYGRYPASVMPDWKWFSGATIVEIVPGGIIARTEKVKETRVRPPVSYNHSIVAYGGGGGLGPVISRETIQGEPFMVLHCPAASRSAEGHSVSFAAMRVGYTSGGRMQLYDYGLPPVFHPRTNSPAAPLVEPAAPIQTNAPSKPVIVIR